MGPLWAFWNALSSLLQWRTIQPIAAHGGSFNVLISLILIPLGIKILDGLSALGGTESDLFDLFSVLRSIEPPFSFFLAYCSALLFFIASILFKLFCPRFLQLYPNAGSAIINGEVPQSLREYTLQAVKCEYRDGKKVDVEPERINSLVKLTKMYNFGADGGKVSSQVDLNYDFFRSSVETTRFREAADKYGYYAIQKQDGTAAGETLIQRDQLLKLQFLELENFLVFVYPIPRILIGVLISIGAIFSTLVLFETIVFVFSTFWP
jgi:hypothetical protein